MLFSKTTLFFIIILISFLVFNVSVEKNTLENIKIKDIQEVKNIRLILTHAFIITVFLYFLYLIFNVCNASKDNFTFNVTPERKCCSGVYKDEKQLKKCNNMKLDKHCCKQRGLYNGKPINFEYTPDTNDYWDTKF